MVDPDAVQAWRRAGTATEADSLRVLAGELPELLAGAVWEAFERTEGPHRRATAGALAGCWYLCTLALLDRLRRDVPELGDPDAVPREIDHLRSIFADARTTGGRQS